jgi:hypothetical protein
VKIAIRANRAASGCPLLAVELPAMSVFGNFLVLVRNGFSQEKVVPVYEQM